MLGLTSKYSKCKLPKFVKVYKSHDLELSIKEFCYEVRNNFFPNNQFCYMKNKEIFDNVTYLKFNKKK